MAFESVVKVGRGDVRGLTLKWNKGGSIAGHVSVAIRGDHKMIEVEIDRATNVIRVKPGDISGAKLHTGTFSLSASFGRKMIPEGEDKRFIPLSKSSDGWWYGDYSK